MITLKAAHLQFVAAFPNWISNGKWAIRRELVANAAIFTSESTIRAAFPKVEAHDVRVSETDNGISQIHATLGANLQPFTVTSWTYDGDGDRFALLTCGHLSAFIPRARLALLGNPTQLYGVDGRSAFTDAIEPDERTLLVMPAVIVKDNTHLTPLISLVHLMDLAADANPELVGAAQE